MLRCPAGKHAFEDATVVRVGEAEKLPGKPTVELRLARVVSNKVGLELSRNSVVLLTKRTVPLEVPLSEQDLKECCRRRHPLSCVA